MAGYQVLGIRSFYDERTRQQKKYDAFFEQRWRFDDIAEVYRDPKAILDRNKVPEHERWNLFYTVNQCGDTKRSFKRAEILPFDLDGIDTARYQEYVPVVLELLQADSSKTAIVYSGNGLHFIIQMYPPIDDKNFFKERRSQYRAICTKINQRLEELRLPGKADPAVFDAARILRFPGTVNRKPDKLKPDILINKECTVLASVLAPQPFDFDKVSGAPKLSSEEAIPLNELKRYKNNDGHEAFNECLFLKHVRDDAASLPEPEWYASASIIGRFEKGRELFHAVSKGHPGYREGVTNEKFDQAVSASGPRTCDNINDLWGGCRDCPLFQKIKSPVVIFGKDVIATEATGFYDVIANDDPTKAPKLIPNYGDLLKAFIRDHHYFIDTKTERPFIFDTTHWRTASELELHGYAEHKFCPPPKQTMRTEFGKKVFANNQRTEKVVLSFFQEGIRGKLNLKNGILDLASNEISAHTHDLGFTYCLPYDYVPDARAPIFEKFLNEITCGNKDLAASLLDFMGYLLIPRMDDHCFLWLAGAGRNGKSTFMEVLQSLVGDENASAVMLDQFDNENNLEMMNHKLLNISEESDSRRIPAKLISTLKALSAGGITTVNQKYEVAYKMRPTAKLVFASNVRPRLDGAGQALASRMILVPFNMQLENYREGSASKVDAKLLGKMKAELPGILNLAISRVRLQAEQPFYRIHRAPESQEEVRQIFVESDPIESWLEDACEFVTSQKTATKLLYESYKGYMAAHHPREYQQAIRQFSSSLRGKLQGKIESCEIGHDKVSGFKGVTLKTPVKGVDY